MALSVANRLAAAVLVLAAAAASCAKGAAGEALDDGTGTDASTSQLDAGGRDSAPLPPFDAGGDEDAPVQDDGGGCAKTIVINELASHGATASAEFVELYNPNACAVSLASWKLAYKSKTNTAGPDLYGFQAGDAIAAHAYFVLGSSSFTGKKDATMTGGMSDDGEVGLLDDTKKLVDGVGLGAAAGGGGSYVEGQAAPAQTSNGGSVARVPNGTDTNDNRSDFKAVATATPGASN